MHASSNQRGTLSGIRTNAAAELLGVSPNTLRSWERRFGYPEPRRSAGGHRQYELGELEALRRALLETHNISSAIEVARQRGEGPGSAHRLLEAFDRFDDVLADRFLEESLSLRSIERTVEEILLPGHRAGRGSRRAARPSTSSAAAGRPAGCTRSAGSRRRPPAPRACCCSTRARALGGEVLHVQALELALRRGGFRVLLLSVELAQERVTRAMRALDPSALVLCGSGATLDAVGRLVYAVRQTGSQAPLCEYRGSMPVTGSHNVPSLGRHADRRRPPAASARVDAAPQRHARGPSRSIGAACPATSP